MAPFEEARGRALAAIAAGRMDGMAWFTPERVRCSADLGRRLPWARSLLALAWPYNPAPAPPAGRRPRGRVAAYALLSPRDREATQSGGLENGVDYHRVLDRECRQLVGWLRQSHPDLRAKRFVDHSWVLERAVAERAGLGFVGKHACLLTPEAGSYVLLAEIALSIPLPPDLPSRRNCGSCQACLPACPTGAITAPGVIDARRCISYLTIEYEGSIPLDLRPLMGTWIFGCDLCQEACPINHRRAPARLPQTTGPIAHPDLIECLRMDEDAFARRFGGTAAARTGRDRLARNAAIALGNAGDRAALPALHDAMESDPAAVVRESAAWAIGRLNEPSEGRIARSETMP